MKDTLNVIQEMLLQQDKLNEQEKEALTKALADADKQWAITEFKLDRTEKVKRTTAILLEETIEELEQKRKAVELQNRVLEVEAALERVRAVALGMQQPKDMLEVCRIICDQLGVLGAGDIRNVQTAIFNEGRQVYLNYEYFRLTEKRVITEVDYRRQPDVHAFVDQMMSDPEAFFTTTFEGDRIREWIAYQQQANQFIDPFMLEAKSVHYYFYSIGPGALGLSTYQPLPDDMVQLLKRFRNVFELAYRRFNDIQQAMAQAKEAQVEAALEKVRADAMGMRDSSEIGVLIYKLYGELTKLDAKLDRCFIMMVNPDNEGITWWLAGKEGLLAENGFFVQRNDYPAHLMYLRHWRERKKKWHYLFEGQEKADWDRFGFQMTALAKLPNYIKEDMASVRKIHLSGSSESFGCLVTGSLEPLPEEQQDIISRFTVVFNQTYTRFLDLQKAEAQAREAEIQLALERVRARSLAMHHTAELQDVVNVVARQLLSIGIDINGGVFITINKEIGENLPLWAAAGMTDYVQKVVVPTLNKPFFTRLLDALKQPDHLYIEQCSWEEKVQLFEHLFQYEPWKSTPAKRKKELLSREGGLTRSIAVSHYTSIAITDHYGKKFSEGENEILIRFGKVFEQSYIRFLDLQKAEAQAREAEIQLALERVRAKTMAMQKQGDLLGVLELLVEQLVKLGVQLEVANFSNGLPEGDWNLWIHAVVNGAIFSNYVHIPRIEHPYFTSIENSIRNYRENGIELSKAVFTKEEKNTWQLHMYANTIYRDIAPEEIKQAVYEKPGYCWSVIMLKDTWLSIARYNTIQFTDEEDALLFRFADAFGHAYTRFLDLKKAEAQAREAEIQLALERVRAKTMAMQKKDDLIGVLELLVEQFTKLGVYIDIANFSDGLPEKDWYLWAYSIPGGGIINSQYVHIPTIDHSFFNRIKKSIDRFRTEGFDLTKEVFTKEEKDSFYQHLYTNTLYKDAASEEEKQFVLSTPGYTWSAIILHETWVSIARLSTTPFSDEEDALLRRFANAFSLAYTRFLDLKKAEEQARETEIELCLERIRSRAIAMHNSSELTDVLSLFFQQFKFLGIDTMTAALNVFDQPANKFTHYTTDKSGNTVHTKQEGNIDASELWQPLIEGWKKDKHLSVSDVFYPHESLDTLFSYFSDLRAGIPKEYLLVPADFPEGMHQTMVNCEFGNIGFIGAKKLDEAAKAILVRFTKEFERMYRRFLDLQKAEAQAREAEIQLALERVRARTMAMQKSEELGETAALLFQQVKLLGIDSYASGFTVWENDDAELVSWMSNADGSVNPPFRMPAKDNAWHRRQLASWKKREDHIIHEFAGKEMQQYYAYLRSFPLLNESFAKSEAAGVATPSKQVHNVFNFAQGNLLFITTKHVPEAYDIFRRFAKTFEQSYTRFLDLQRAEAQAREAEIELGLERVRARAMAMQKSDELKESATVLYKELMSLRIGSLYNCGYVLIDEKNQLQHAWMTHADGRIREAHTMPLQGDPIMNERFEQWKRRNKLFSQQLGGKKLRTHLAFVDRRTNAASAREPSLSKFPDPAYFYCGNFPEGYLHVISFEELSKESELILSRFTTVFEQTYTRFLDLKKAEAQAREAQIEAALERVRSSAMAMHRSNELAEVAKVMFNQIKMLGGDLFAFGIVLCDQQKDTVEQWHGLGEGEMMTPFRVPVDLDYIHRFRYDQWKAGVELFSIEIPSDYIAKHFQLMFELPSVRAVMDDLAAKGINLVPPSWEIDYGASFRNGYLLVSSLKPFKEETIFPRFANVFEQAYTRFLDLKKAEEQTREAQIEVSVERVRAKALAMHKSDEIHEVVRTLRNELFGLNLEGITGATICLQQTDGQVRLWDITDVETKGRYGWDILFDINQIDPELWVKRIWDSGKQIVATEQDANDLRNALNWLGQYDRQTADEIMELLETHDIRHGWHRAAKLANGILITDFTIDPPAEIDSILLKMGAAFDLAYKRFLDLQKAEAQAREAKIEAALERVRAQTMAMQKQDDLISVLNLLVDQLIHLGVPVQVANFSDGIPDGDWHLWLLMPTGDGGTTTDYVHFPEIDHPYFKSVQHSLEIYKNGGTDLSKKVFLKEDKDTFLDYMFSQTRYKDIMPPEGKEFLYATPGHTWSAIILKDTWVSINKYDISPFTHEEDELLRRFAIAFGLAYTRFVDLQNAEANAREALRRASIERVRGDIASMRTTKDLERITPLIWNELTILGVPFFRCGVFIIEEELATVNLYLSTPEGQSIASLKLSFGTSSLTDEVVTYWRTQQVYKAHWAREDFKAWVQTLMQQGHLQQENQYTAGAEVPENLWLHFIPFAQGMLYVGSTAVLHEDQLALVQSLADAFATAYARYEDFVRLEAANRQIENTLEDLKATQRQLVQSEKMASLGELTAGIAHEIQNPLNFVNNFSEVSQELIEEMNEALDFGNAALAREIGADVKQNLEKIHHHGKRADEIVKGMLLHSRSSSGVKEPTDINALCDEYLRLAYHGLRAKDKSFNATFNAEFDPAVGKVNVMPQEMGRVILNLINNAFYAVSEKQKQGIAHYEPTVSVSTRRSGDRLEIAVADNGNGIADAIREKIFQPFFTTKPTGQGTGLGLSLSYDIVKAHGGELKVETKENEGTRFIVQLSAM